MCHNEKRFTEPFESHKRTMLWRFHCLYELRSSEVKADVRPRQGIPKKTTEAKFDWLRATANWSPNITHKDYSHQVNKVYKIKAYSNAIFKLYR